MLSNLYMYIKTDFVTVLLQSSHVIRNRSHSSKPPDEITGIRQDNKIVNPQSNSKPVNKAQKISRAMRAYLEKAKKYGKQSQCYKL